MSHSDFCIAGIPDTIFDNLFVNYQVSQYFPYVLAKIWWDSVELNVCVLSFDIHSQLTSHIGKMNYLVHALDKFIIFC